jgi:hypothetical protein
MKRGSKRKEGSNRKRAIIKGQAKKGLKGKQ